LKKTGECPSKNIKTGWSVEPRLDEMEWKERKRIVG
jgi:hypothetical protein